MTSQHWKVVLATMVLVECLLMSSGSAHAASPTDFSSATKSIDSAFVATCGAGQSGGNVSQLVARLNIALSLVSEAQAENGTNPAKAAIDLQNATQIAESVAASSPSISQLGSESRQATVATSEETALAIVIAAALIYIFGDRVYRRLWLFVYRGFLVGPSNV